MTATVGRGGDLHDAVDWLCLNLPNGKYRFYQPTVPTVDHTNGRVYGSVSSVCSIHIKLQLHCNTKIIDQTGSFVQIWLKFIYFLLLW